MKAVKSARQIRKEQKLAEKAQAERRNVIKESYNPATQSMFGLSNLLDCDVDMTVTEGWLADHLSGIFNAAGAENITSHIVGEEPPVEEVEVQAVPAEETPDAALAEVVEEEPVIEEEPATEEETVMPVEEPAEEIPLSKAEKKAQKRAEKLARKQAKKAKKDEETIALPEATLAEVADEDSTPNEEVVAVEVDPALVDEKMVAVAVPMDVEETVTVEEPVLEEPVALVQVEEVAKEDKKAQKRAEKLARKEAKKAEKAAKKAERAAKETPVQEVVNEETAETLTNVEEAVETEANGEELGD